MQIELDSHKRDKTLAERGLDFARSGEVFAEVNVTFSDNRIDYGVQQFKSSCSNSERCNLKIGVPLVGANTTW